MTESKVSHLKLPEATLTDRFKVLLIAYACEPNRGSEPGTGWNLSIGLSYFHDVTVVTRTNNRPAIEKQLERQTGMHPKFLYVDPPGWLLWLKRKRLLPVQLFYFFWQLSVSKALKEKTASFDVIHQLTFNSFEVPPITFLNSRSTLVWGPIGGGQTVAESNIAAFGFIGGLKERLRNIRVRLSALNPIVSKILRQCSKVIFANCETRDLLVHYCKNDYSMMIDVGVDSKRFPAKDNYSKGQAITIVAAGRFEPRKGFLLLIKAFEDLIVEYPLIKLKLIGDGPDKRNLLDYVRQHDLENHVHFTGLVDHAAMVKQLSMSDIFVFPSLRDTSGAVVLEAMAVGLPIVTFDHQGAAIMVDETCGIKATAPNLDSAISNLKSSIMRLIEDAELREKLGRNARERAVTNYDWSKKVDILTSIYKSVIKAPRSSDS